MSTSSINKHVHESGAVRSKDTDGLRFSLMQPAALRSLAAALAEGEAKYGKDNYLKGFNFSLVVDHAINHIISFLERDESEDHLGHALWNIATLIQYVADGRTDLDDRTDYKGMAATHFRSEKP